jgi:hypothetical protein
MKFRVKHIFPGRDNHEKAVPYSKKKDFKNAFILCHWEINSEII